MESRQVGSASHPLLAFGMLPERTHHLPALPVVDRAEEAAGQGSTPDGSGLVGAAGRQCPDSRRAPVERTAPHVKLLVALRLGRVDGSGDLLPTVSRRTVKLDPEVTMVQRRILQPVASVGQRERDIVAEKIDFRDLPAAAVARYREQSLAGRNQKPVAHHYPPERAWKT